VRNPRNSTNPEETLPKPYKTLQKNLQNLYQNCGIPVNPLENTLKIVRPLLKVPYKTLNIPYKTINPKKNPNKNEWAALVREPLLGPNIRRCVIT
jgi:hypothetical protein